jgi:hypothetical protein
VDEHLAHPHGRESGASREEREARAAFGTYLLMVLSAEVVFALLVTFVLGTPPAGGTIVAFGVVMAVGLGLQRRSERTTRVDSTGRRGPRSTRR